MLAVGSVAALVVARLQEGWQTLRSELLPTKVVLELSDQLLVAQRLLPGSKALEEAWMVPIPAATCRQGQPLQVEALGDFIGDLLLSYGEIKAHLSVVLPAAAAHWRVLDWPLQEWPLEPAVRLRQLQPDLSLPFPLEEAYLDLMPLQGEAGRALVVAIERNLLNLWMQVFGIAGVRLDRLVPAQVALTAALQERLMAADPRLLVCLLLPEVKALRLLVWRAGVPLYERLLEGGAEQGLAQLQRCLQFLRGQQGDLADAPPPQVLLAAGLLTDQQDELLASSPLPLEPLSSAGYGSLALQGLAALEAAR